VWGWQNPAVLLNCCRNPLSRCWARGRLIAKLCQALPIGEKKGTVSGIWLGAGGCMTPPGIRCRCHRRGRSDTRHIKAFTRRRCPASTGKWATWRRRISLKRDCQGRRGCTSLQPLLRNGKKQESNRERSLILSRSGVQSIRQISAMWIARSLSGVDSQIQNGIADRLSHPRALC